VDKRYQVFVSSTYADLEAERRAVIQTVIELDCIPAGMELFPAVDDEQFEFIKRVIDDCDYYLVIIGGRYGSTTADGVSYTEKEYDYAMEVGLKVIALIHGSPDDIPFGKSETDPVLRERLERFRDKVATGRLVKFWTTSSELPGLVALSLSKTIKMFPAIGWVRASAPASEDILGEVNELRKANDALTRQVSAMAAAATPAIEDVAGLDDSFTLTGEFTTYSSSGSGRRSWSADATWRDVFAAIGPYLYEYPNDTQVKNVLEKAMFKRSGKGGYSPSLDDQVFKTVAVQLRTLGLIKTEYLKATTGGMALFWSLTPTGEAEMLRARVVRKESGVKAEDQ
jgi:Domain of unknown function (DUF4062)